MNIRVYPTHFQGELRLPSSKSWSHRAMMLAALSDGVSEIRGLTMSDDLLATQACLSQWGVQFKGTTIQGPIQQTGPSTCHAGASGTTLRMLMPFALLSSFPTTWTGEERLVHRSLRSFAAFCHRYGYGFEPHSSQQQLPVTVKGPLLPGDYVIDSTETSQFISGLLMVLPLLSGPSTVRLEGNTVSLPYIDLTVAMMKAWGVTLKKVDSTFFIPGYQAYQPQSLDAEPDASHAAFFLCGALLAGDILLKGRWDQSDQGDTALLNILRAHGATLTDTPTGYRMQTSSLTPLNLSFEAIPDLAPMLILTSGFIDGISTFRGLARLNDKESARFEHIQSYLRLWRIPFNATEDTLEVIGSSLHRIPEGSYSTYRDHRLAMSLAMLSPMAESSFVIEDITCISKSFPTFLQTYTAMQGRYHKEGSDE